MRPSSHSDSSSSASCLAHGEELEVKFDLWSALLSSSFWWLMVSFIDPGESGSINTQMEKCCKEGKGHVILPIFYLMEPRDVRYQKRSYEEAFQQHSEQTFNLQGKGFSFSSKMDNNNGGYNGGLNNGQIQEFSSMQIRQFGISISF
ncbi:hypothetical protein LINPERPRIM_LOCUS27064 [Linum perenne]